MASVTITYTAFNTATQGYVDNDAANHTLKVVVDGVESTPSGTPVSKSNGEYALTLLAAECSGRKITVSGSSSTNNVIIIPQKWDNSAANADAKLRGLSVVSASVDPDSNATSVIRGDSYEDGSENGRLEYTLTGILGSSISKIWYTIKKDASEGDSDLTLQLTLADSEIAITDTGADAEIAVTLTAAQTAALSARAYVFDIQVQMDDDSIATPIIGVFTVTADVTRATS
jgi:hypothetical protein